MVLVPRAMLGLSAATVRAREAGDHVGTSTESGHFEVVSVDGNKVVVTARRDTGRSPCRTTSA